jgi:predicted O-methyltransferase YrrM
MDFHKLVQDKFATSDRLGHDNMPVYLRKGTRETLAECFGIMGFNTGVEIGTRKGIFAKTLCQANPKLHLYCVDPWMAYAGVKQQDQDILYDIAKKALTGLNVTLVRKFSMDALDNFEMDSLDFVYIDGNHTFDYCCSDIIFWSRKVKPGGVVAVHDYMPGTWHGVMQAVDAYTHCHDIRPWYTTRERESTAFWMKVALPRYML